MIISKNFDIDKSKYFNDKDYINNILELDNPEFKKFAIILLGNIRTLKKNIKNLSDVFEKMRKLNYSFDIFYCTTDTDVIEYNSFFQFADGLIIDEELDFSVNESFNNNTFLSLKRYIHQIYGYHVGFKKIIEYQKKNNIYYENIFRLRFDHQILLDDFIFDEKIIIPYTNFFRMNDRTAYGKQYKMYFYMNCIAFVNDYKKKIHAETFLYDILSENYCKIYVDNGFEDKKVLYSLKKTIKNYKNLNIIINYNKKDTKICFSIFFNTFIPDYKLYLYIKYDLNSKSFKFITIDENVFSIVKNNISFFEKNIQKNDEINNLFISTFFDILKWIKNINKDINFYFYTDDHSDINFIKLLKEKELNINIIYTNIFNFLSTNYLNIDIDIF